MCLTIPLLCEDAGLPYIQTTRSFKRCMLLSVYLRREDGSYKGLEFFKDYNAMKQFNSIQCSIDSNVLHDPLRERQMTRELPGNRGDNCAVSHLVLHIPILQDICNGSIQLQEVYSIASYNYFIAQCNIVLHSLNTLPMMIYIYCIVLTVLYYID